MRNAKSPSELGFTHLDRQRLRRALKQVSDARSFRRIQAVLMFAEGLPIPQIARISGSSERAVYQWVAWYARDHQVEILYERPRSGRPPVARRITDARIRREIVKNPDRLGYNSLEWTAPLLARHLSSLYDCTISAATLRRRMHRMDLRWKRPRHAFTGKDPNRAQKKARSAGN
jgi:transposase